MPTEITPALAERAWDLVHGTNTGNPMDVASVAKRLKLSKAEVFTALAAHR